MWVENTIRYRQSKQYHENKTEHARFQHDENY